MSLFFNTNDGVHLDRVNATQMAKRGIFVNVKPADDATSEIAARRRASSIFYLENNHNLPPSLRRDDFAKVDAKKVHTVCVYVCIIQMLG